MSQINGLSNIRTSQRVHLRSISKKGRSKFLTLFMLDNERQLLQKDSEILEQRQKRNQERIKAINAEIQEKLDQEHKPAEKENGNRLGISKMPEKWTTAKIDI